MSDPHALTLGFLEYHPKQAAQAIEDLDTADACAFLDKVPARICVDVFAAAAPWSAASWIESMQLLHAATVLRGMLYQDATSILRLVPKTHRDKVFEELPTSVARKFNRSLTYPTTTVGAWMDPSVATFDGSTSVEDGLKFLKSRRRRPMPHLVIVGERKAFAGMVSVTDMLRTAPSAHLSEVADRSVEPLSNRALLASILHDAAWDDYPALPVVGRRDNVLGTLSRANLKKGLTSMSAASQTASSESVLAHLVAGYVTVASGLARVLGESPSPQQTPGDRR